MAKGKRAIVMELSGQQAVVMTSDGEFLRTKVADSVVVGQDITISTAKRFNWKSVPARSAVAGLAAVVVLGIGVGQALFGSRPSVEAYASVSVDINPSISFDLSRSMKVIDVYGTNTSGTALVKHLHVQGQSIDVAIRDMMREVAREGKLSSNHAVIVAASSPNGQVDNIQNQVTADVHKALDVVSQGNPVTAQVYSMNVANSVWTDAKKAKVSPGQYASYLLGNEAGVNVKLSQVTSSDMQLTLAQAHDLKSSVKALNSGHFQSVANIVQGAVSRAKQTAATDNKAKKGNSTHVDVAKILASEKSGHRNHETTRADSHNKRGKKTFKLTVGKNN